MHFKKTRALIAGTNRAGGPTRQAGRQCRRADKAEGPCLIVAKVQAPIFIAYHIKGVPQEQVKILD
jgi:hypothetical protein